MDGVRSGKWHRGHLAAGITAVASVSALALLAFAGDDNSPTGGRTEGPPSAPIVGANCERFGGLTNASISRRASNLTVGPITFVSLGEHAHAPASNFAPVRRSALRDRWVSGRADAAVRREVREGSLYPVHKVLVVIAAGDGHVTVAIPKSARDRASLLWGPTPGITRSEARLGWAQASDGNADVRFKRCQDQSMEYVGGGFVVAGEVCLPLKVWFEGQPRPRSVVASFGAGKRCEPT